MNDIRDRLLGMATKETLESSAALSNMFPSDREKYPLADFEGTFTGEIKSYQDTNRQTGEVYEFPAFVVTDIVVHTKTKQDYNPNGEYLMVVDDPKPEKFAQSRLGMMVESALESGAIKSSLGDLKGKRFRGVLNAKKPWPSAKGPNFFYNIRPGGGR